MDTKDIVVQFKETESEIFLHLVPKAGIDLVSSDMKGVTLQFQVDWGIVIPKQTFNCYALLYEQNGVVYLILGIFSIPGILSVVT